MNFFVIIGTDGKVSETVDENAEDKGTENPEESKEKIEMHVIGQDDNVRTRSLDELSMAEVCEIIFTLFHIN